MNLFNTINIDQVENEIAPRLIKTIVRIKKIQKELLFFHKDIYKFNNLAKFSPKFHLKILILDKFVNSILELNINLQMKIIISIISK